ncbi:hypothetical protein HOU02_gp272 [Caulobacter phage CcrBL9]|uniref:Uncharacterized protein n=1 Tax=Caulobacter phage CcrBL9 TaxID=2283270 RepID=A0A385ECE7_9CAUD|nr:hypothetical protein HOU02_gp272 [Caulobacter phage CcrBL9]AXQ69453.1 hypothetical protein CcrBL9_gp429 [Caulobacter phage CcrBL9]
MIETRRQKAIAEREEAVALLTVLKEACEDSTISLSSLRAEISAITHRATKALMEAPLPPYDMYDMGDIWRIVNKVADEGPRLAAFEIVKRMRR